MNFYVATNEIKSGSDYRCIGLMPNAFLYTKKVNDNELIFP